MNAKTKVRDKNHVYGKGGVLYTFPEGEGGPINIKFDFRLIPPPTNYYYADAIVLHVDLELQMATLSFGRREGKTNRLADRIDIVMPMVAINQFWSSSRDVEKTVDQVLSGLKIGPAFGATAPEDSTVMTLFANIIFIAVGIGDTCLDFYHLSSRDVHFAKTGKMDMQLQPTVRVILSAILTKYFFDLLRTYVNNDHTAPQPGARGVKNASISR
jgi:hypothetical protein